MMKNPDFITEDQVKAMTAELGTPLQIKKIENTAVITTLFQFRDGSLVEHTYHVSEDKHVFTLLQGQ